MNEPRADLADSFMQTLKASTMPDTLANLAEVGLDTVLADGPVRDVPIIGTLLSLWRTGVTVRDALFAQKLLTFLLPTLKVRPEIRRKMIAKLQNSSSVAADVGQQLISLLERLDSVTKAGVVANAFIRYLKESLDAELFWRVTLAIDRLPLHDLLSVSTWQDTKPNHIPHIRQQMFLSAGVLVFVLDTSSTGFFWNRSLCNAIAECLPQPQSSSKPPSDAREASAERG